MKFASIFLSSLVIASQADAACDPLHTMFAAGYTKDMALVNLTLDVDDHGEACDGTQSSCVHNAVMQSLSIHELSNVLHQEGRLLNEINDRINSASKCGAMVRVKAITDLQYEEFPSKNRQ